ncbi:lipopolysaccharide kinase InaA family protein [Streptomyces sp. SID3343]|uniref:lipopolysaccharide kinase InaA family protein n=1 Tax=Streptomyces sp. SID3343 TaxID=2690260 RepID=UPI00136FC690|nr:lipopolysaccharide kinase InaA family protein [Streptomyces sp. SID3343]MYW04789.1 phosphotransferase [Streptomyces sp. SID3343]
MDPLLAAAVAALDVPDEPRPLSPYHARAWRTRNWKIKAAGTPAGVAKALHEVRAVELLRDAGLTTTTGAHGRIGDEVWTAVTWAPGETLWQWCAHGATPQDVAPRLRDVADRAFALLGRWHRAGWRHGDVHPGNILITETGDVVFIDHDLTHHRDLLPLPGPYRGGGDQATAPEIARRLLDTGPDVDIELTAAAETYSLGASLRWAWTGQAPATPRAVGADGVTPSDVLTDIVTGRRRVPLAEARPWPDPDLERLVEDTMRLDPSARGTGAPAHSRRA